MLILNVIFTFSVALAAINGPHKGPVAQSNKKIAFILSDAKNGGVMGAKAGFMEATRLLSWKVEVRDGNGDMDSLKRHLEEALSSNVDGVVLCGFQPDKEYVKLLQAKKKQIVVVGWHAGAKPGPLPGLFTNVSTEPSEVGRLTVQALKKVGSKKPGVVLITDNRFSIAREKTQILTNALDACSKCRLLAVVDIPISEAQEKIPEFVQKMNAQFGKAWTHTVAINDIYFDNMNFPLRDAGRQDIANIAAGDGSDVAISRIKGGGSQQAATVAEPLFFQGWQIADELNRGFAGKKESGFVTKPILVNKEFLATLSGEDIEEPLNFRKAYSKIWLKK